MAIWGRLLFKAANIVASDRRVRAKVAEVLEHDLKPLAAETWRRAKPNLEATRDEIRDIAGETNPRQNPRAFATKIKERFIDRKTGH